MKVAPLVARWGMADVGARWGMADVGASTSRAGPLSCNELSIYKHAYVHVAKHFHATYRNTDAAGLKTAATS